MILLSKINLFLLMLNSFIIGINVLGLIMFGPSITPIIAIAISSFAINLVFKNIKNGR